MDTKEITVENIIWFEYPLTTSEGYGSSLTGEYRTPQGTAWAQMYVYDSHSIGDAKQLLCEKIKRELEVGGEAHN